MKISTPLKWIVLFPASILTYFIVHALTVLLVNVLNFMHPHLAYGKGFIESVLAPGVAAYYAITLPLNFFDIQSGHPGKILGAVWVLGLGLLAGFAVFTSAWGSLLASVVSCIVIVAALNYE